MALRDIPVWVLPPDWADPVTEGLEWLTQVMASVTGVEQRQQLRVGPRRSLEYTVQAHRTERAVMDSLLTAPDQTDFYLPVWFDAVGLPVVMAAGASLVILPGVHPSFADAKAVHVTRDNPLDFEILEVTSVFLGSDYTTVNFAAPTELTWAPHSLIRPMVVARLTEQPKYTNETDETSRMSVHFDVLEPPSWPLAPSLPSYRGSPVYEFGVNGGDTQDGDYQRRTAEVDNTVGQRYRQDQGRRAFPSFKSTDFTLGRTSADQVRSVLYALRGKCASSWMVLPTSDLHIVQPIPPGGTQLVTEISGLTDAGGPREGRRDIRILYRNGTASHHRITASAVIPNGLESLTIDPAVLSGADPRNVDQISYMMYGRLDQDLVSLDHITDADGACSVALSVRAVPEIRIGTDWTPPDLPYTTPESCYVAPEDVPVPAYTGFLSVNNDPSHAVFSGPASAVTVSIWAYMNDENDGVLNAGLQVSLSDYITVRSTPFSNNDALQGFYLRIPPRKKVNPSDDAPTISFVYGDGTQYPGDLDLVSEAGGFAWADNQLVAGAWNHFLLSVAFGAGTPQLYVNDAVAAPSGTAVRNGHTMAAPTANPLGGFGALHTFDGRNPYFAHLWVAPVLMDLSDTAVRRKFISALETPVSMGAHGETPLGVAPALYVARNNTGALASLLQNRAGTLPATPGTVVGAIDTATIVYPPALWPAVANI